MKPINIYFFCTILSIFFISCSSSDDNANTSQIENSPPDNFLVTILNVSHNKVEINWSQSIDPENEIVKYDVYVDNVLLASNLDSLSYTVYGLNELTNYTGKIIAKDSNNNETSENFSFQTIKYYLKFIKYYDFGPNKQNGQPFNILKTEDNNFLISGFYSDDGVNLSLFVFKFDYDGNILWQRYYPYNFENGSFEKTKLIEYLTGYLLVGNAYVIHLDLNGNIIWQKTIDSYYDSGYGNSQINSIDVDDSNFIYVVGGRGVLSDEHAEEGVITKVDQSGNILWERTYNTNYRNLLVDVKINSSNELIILGSSGTDNQNQFWVIKTDTNGNIIWQNTIGNGYCFPRQIIPTNDGNYVFAGHSWGAYDISSGYLYKISETGNILWEKQSDIGTIYSIDQLTDNSLVASGYKDAGIFTYITYNKFDADGNNLWSREYFEEYTYLYGRYVISDQDGGFRIISNRDKIYFDPGDNPKLAFLKFDPDGNFQ